MPKMAMSANYLRRLAILRALTSDGDYDDGLPHRASLGAAIPLETCPRQHDVFQGGLYCIVNAICIVIQQPMTHAHEWMPSMTMISSPQEHNTTTRPRCSGCFHCSVA